MQERYNDIRCGVSLLRYARIIHITMYTVCMYACNTTHVIFTVCIHYTFNRCSKVCGIPFLLLTHLRITNKDTYKKVYMVI